MYTHAPPNYACPICLAVQGVWSRDTMIQAEDIVYRDDRVMAIINSKWIKNNPGHVIVVPITHYEHIYDLPDHIAERIATLSKHVASALKVVRDCEGVTVLQNNEPASEQHAFHYHMHVIPRFSHDNMYEHISHARVSLPEERLIYARDISQALAESSDASHG